jgi:hypothetical protein
MAKQFDGLSEQHIEFIAKQKIYFVATAASDGRVNLSPKGLDSFHVADKNHVMWLNLTGSGNETAAHLLDNNRMTVMFCSFDAVPLILRIYGSAKTIHKYDPEWHANYAKFTANPGARQIYQISIDMVQTSCGYAVPNYDFVDDKETLVTWAENKGEEGVEEYWQERNKLSIDGKETGI